jgi:hypothetical protein
VPELDQARVIAERMRRQRLAKPLTASDDYVALFRLLQPVSPAAFTRPGSPPSLQPRTAFDDRPIADALRARRGVVKGRFLGGNLAYVLADDLALYANVFCKPLDRYSAIRETVAEVVERSGPLTPRQLKEETGLLNKQIMPALHRLQRAVHVYEDQVDDDWERGWYHFASEWPDVIMSEDKFHPAAADVLLRFLDGHVFATFEQLKDWSQLSAKSLKTLIRDMEAAGLIQSQKVKGLGEGWAKAELQLPRARAIKPSVFMLHRGDYLVRSHATELKRRFGDEEVLQYLFIDGRFQGAVLGHWRIGPHDVSDITIELPAAERSRRRDEIVSVVARQYRPPRHRIQRYGGKALPKRLQPASDRVEQPS